MRKSVKAKKAKELQQQQALQRRHRRIALWLTVPFTASAALLLLSVTNWSVTQYVGTADAAIRENRQAAAAYAKTSASKKAEAEAKAKMEAEMAAKAETERTIAAAKQTNPANTTSCATTDVSSVTVVINKKHCFSPLDWAPGDLASVNGYLLRQQAATQMTAMMQASASAGYAFDLSSTYRSYASQQTTYNNWVQVNGSAELADTVSARPGYSEHQTGLAADVKTEGCVLECFAGTGAYTWLKQHAAEYGFIERYPAGLSDITGYAPEAWHWRYVGTATAQDMKAKGIQTLEQYFGIPGGSY